MDYNEIAETATTQFDNEQRELDQEELDIENAREELRERSKLPIREQELADGHADVRFSGYVAVTAASEDELAQACAEVEQQAGQARLELVRLDGDQEAAFTYTLPLGRGLR